MSQQIVVPVEELVSEGAAKSLKRKEILSRGRELGRVLHVSEAFSKYPAEEED